MVDKPNPTDADFTADISPATDTAEPANPPQESAEGDLPVVKIDTELVAQNINSHLAEALEKAPLDLSFLNEVYAGDPKKAEKVRVWLKDALKDLEDGKDILMSAREKSAMSWYAEQAKRFHERMDPLGRWTPDKNEVSRITAPAVTAFLQSRMRREEFDVRSALALAGNGQKDISKKMIHWVTVICFRTPNSRGGYNTDNRDDHQLFVDAADKMPSKDHDIRVGRVSDIGNLGLEIYDPANREHTTNYRASCGQMMLKGASNLELDRHSLLLLKALEARDVLHEYSQFPDSLAVTLLEAINKGNMPSEAVSDRLLARLAARYK